MMLLLVMLTLLTFSALVVGVCVLFQRWEDRQLLQTHIAHVAALRAHLDQLQSLQAQTDELIGHTWMPTAGDQARVEQLLTTQGTRRQHARTGSDPFTHSAKLAP